MKLLETPELTAADLLIRADSAPALFRKEVEADHGNERGLLYRELIILLALALFVALRAAIL